MVRAFVLSFALLFAAFTATAADKPIAVVAGATGETGAHVVRALNAKGFAVRGLVRDAAKAKAQLGDIATWVVGDVTKPETLTAAFAGATYAVSAIGSREREGPNNFENVDWIGNRNLIDAAKAAGVKAYVLTTSGSAGVDAIDADPTRFAGRQWKGKAEDYLRASGLNYAVVAPGGLRNYAGGEKGIQLQPRNKYKVGAISRDDVAAVIVECLTNKACASKTITVVNTDNAKPKAWIETLQALPIDTPETIRISVENAP